MTPKRLEAHIGAARPEAGRTSWGRYGHHD